MQFLDLKAPPAITLIEDFKYGYYTPSTIHLGVNADCGVLMHELYHHYQYYMQGPATSRIEQELREGPATKFELFWRGAE